MSRLHAAVWSDGGKRLASAVLALVLAPLPVHARTDAGASPPMADAAPARVPLRVRVHGLRNERGRVAVALFASAESFPDQKRALAGQVVSITRGAAAVTFPSLPPGVYALAVLHDENANDQMDFNFLGMPLEGYGFSNDASAPFGPPGFAAAAFRLLAQPSRVSVKIRYFL